MYWWSSWFFWHELALRKDSDLTQPQELDVKCPLSHKERMWWNLLLRNIATFLDIFWNQICLMDHISPQQELGGEDLWLFSDQLQQCRMTSGNPLFSIVLGMRRGTGGSGVHMQIETSSDHAAAIVLLCPFPSQTRLVKWHPVGCSNVGDHFALPSALSDPAAVLQYFCYYSVLSIVSQ